MDDFNNSRKRSRGASSPKPGGVGVGLGVGVGSGSVIGGGFDNTNTGTTTNENNINPNYQQLQLQHQLVAQLKGDPAQRIAALNKLLQLTSTHDNNNITLIDDALITELINIVINECLVQVVVKEENQDDDNSSNDKDKSEDGESNNDNDEDGDDSDNEDEPQFRSKMAWIDHPTRYGQQWAQHCRKQLTPIQRRGGTNIGGNANANINNIRIFEMIMVIIRNLTFVGANLRLLAYSPRVLQVLVGCLYEETTYYYDNSMADGDTGVATASSLSASSALAYSAIQALVHLAPYFDVSGQKLLADRLFYKPPDFFSTTTTTGDDNTDNTVAIGEGSCVPSHTNNNNNNHKFGQVAGGEWGFGGLWLAKRLDNKEDVVADVKKEFLLEMTSDYLVSVYNIFPALCHLLLNPSKTQSSSRPTTILALDFLQEFMNQARTGMIGTIDTAYENDDKLPSIRSILVNMPDCMLERLVQLLYVPRLGPDALEYIDPLHNIVTRVTTLKLLGGYDATVDTDVRDRVLDILVPLCELDSPRIAERLSPHIIRLVESVVPILNTTAGRNEAPTLAYQLLRELSLSPKNQYGFLYVQDRLIELASSDARISQLVWNHLYAPEDDEEDDDEEEGGESGSEEEEEEEEEEGSGSGEGDDDEEEEEEEEEE